jgi:ribosomal protein L39E
MMTDIPSFILVKTIRESTEIKMRMRKQIRQGREAV